MRPGKVVNIRVNPTDCLGILDVARKVGVDCAGTSFPQIVSLALSTLLQSARNAQQIPTRMGYEYEEEMAPYLVDDRTKRKVKLQRANEIHLKGSDLQAPGLEPLTAQPYRWPETMELREEHKADLNSHKNKEHLYGEFKVEQPHIISSEAPRAASGTTAPAPTKSEAAARLTRLLQKRDAAEDGKAAWTPADEADYKLCYSVVYPEG